MIYESIEEKLFEWLQEKMRTQAVQTREIEALKSSLPKTLLLSTSPTITSLNKNSVYASKRSMTSCSHYRHESPIRAKSRMNTPVDTHSQIVAPINSKEVTINKVTSYLIIFSILFLCSHHSCAPRKTNRSKL
ncbi:unnamed protein product [Trichobilharzia regenti]|nr:unnamed protein product [Trichobilharzia regenti]